MKPVFVTINTDAGYYSWHKVGSYAYWIKGTGLHLHGSGMFKNKCDGPWQAEMQSMLNALHILKKSNPPPIIGFIFNTDSKFSYPSNKGHKYRKQLKDAIEEFQKDCIERIGKKEFELLRNKSKKKYAEFVHVPSHTSTDTKKSWVNDWCDKQCKARLAEWSKQNKQNKFLSR